MATDTPSVQMMLAEIDTDLTHHRQVMADYLNAVVTQAHGNEVTIEDGSIVLPFFPCDCGPTALELDPVHMDREHRVIVRFGDDVVAGLYELSTDDVLILTDAIVQQHRPDA